MKLSVGGVCTIKFFDGQSVVVARFIQKQLTYRVIGVIHPRIKICFLDFFLMIQQNLLYGIVSKDAFIGFRQFPVHGNGSSAFAVSSLIIHHAHGRHGGKDIEYEIQSDQGNQPRPDDLSSADLLQFKSD